MGEAKDTLSMVDDRGFLIDLQDLKKSYRATHRMLANLKKELESAADKGDQEAEDELNTIKGMVINVNYAIEWLHTGKQPGTKRGIDRRSVYQNTVLLDPMIMANFSNAYNSRSRDDYPMTLRPKHIEKNHENKSKEIIRVSE